MIALELTGEGPPLVLVHGVGATRRIWQRVVPPLAAERTVVTPDLPGFGESPPIGPGFDLSEVADTLAAALPGEPMDLVGNSLGGAVAFVLALRHPARVRRLILAAPAGFWRPPGVVATLAGGLGGPFTALRGAVGAPLAASPAARRVLLWGAVAEPQRLSPDMAREMLTASLRARRYGAAVEAVLRADLLAELPRLEVPLGLVWGEQDRIVPVSALRAIQAALPSVPVNTLPGVAHVPQIEAPERFVSALRTLLA